MNVDLRALLDERAGSVVPPRVDPLAVVSRGQHLVRRRNGLRAAGATVLLALAVGTAALFTDRADGPPVPAVTTDRVPANTTGPRPVTYGIGQVLHLGDRTIDTRLDFRSIDLTTEGAALTTFDGGIWFTDGITVDRIGTTLGGEPFNAGVRWLGGRPPGWVVNDTDGSLLAWLEHPTGRPGPELVVYHSGVRAVVLRQALPADTQRAVAIVGRKVFVQSANRGPRYRYDLDTRALAEVEDAVLDAALRAKPRALVVGPSVEAAKLLHWEGSGSAESVSSVKVREGRLDGLWDPRTGRRVEVAVPSGYSGDVWFAQWVDDDRFAVIG